MEKSSFDYLWDLLEPSAGYQNMRAKCESVLWKSMSLFMQRRVYRTIRRWKEEKEAINPNPWFAIVNARDAEPVNYNGSAKIEQMRKKTRLAVAWYKGLAGIYTMEEAKALEMKIEREFR